MSPSSSTDVRKDLALFDLGGGKLISEGSLRTLLPDVETALFFAKVYKLDYRRLSALLILLFKTGVTEALAEGGHSEELQDYLVDTIPEDVFPEDAEVFDPDSIHPEILPQVWEAMEVEVADSIAKVAEKLASTLDFLPGKQGQMVFSHMARLNRQRPTIGTYQAAISHPPAPDNLVILDVSGSMTSSTIRQIIDDVVGLSWKANAHLVIVSNQAYHWEPGTYTVDAVLAQAEYGGTHYEKLVPMLQRDWGTVITIADYDSSASAKSTIREKATGRVGQVLDISLVNRPSFLAECIGQLANEVRPLLVGTSSYVLY